jgi:hypothetical protein
MHNQCEIRLRPTTISFQISRDHAGKRYLKILKKINFYSKYYNYTYSKIKITTEREIDVQALVSNWR